MALTFDQNFAPSNFRVYLWANRGELDAIRFEIGTDALTGVVGGGHPVHDADNVAPLRAAASAGRGGGCCPRKV